MKKITLLIAMLCSLSAFSMRYLVQLGIEGDQKWRAVAEGETLADLSVLSQDLQQWFAATTMAAGDEVWIAGGTYVVNAGIVLKDGVNMYGGFSGTETSVSQRIVGNLPWDFSKPTIIDYNLISPATTGLNCPAAFVNVTVVDGLHITKVAKALTTGNGAMGSIIGTITLKNCKFYDNTFTRNSGTTTVSGGIFARTGSKIENCYFYNNQTLSGDANISNIRGAALSVAGDVSIKGCTFENNTSISNAGAAIIMSNTANHSGGGTFENCIFKNNTAGSNGGAIHSAISQNQTANFSLKNCQFIGNTATSAPAINITNVSFNNNVSIEGCLLAGNIATTGVGAVYIAPNAKILVKYIKNCIFRDNKTNTAGNAGAALNLNSPTTVSNCVFANNTGLSTLNLGIAKDSVYNCTFVNNESEATGAALNIANVDATFKNNIFWGNTTNNINPGTGVLTTGYNAFDKDESTQVWFGEGSINTLTASNTFVMPTSYIGVATTDTQKSEAAAANWSLKNGAPAINSGTTIAAVTTDINGGARPAGSGYDMGAYEFGAISGIRNFEPENVKISISNSMISISSNEITKVSVFNVSGMNIYNSAESKFNHQIQLHSGVYILNIQSQKGIKNQKIVLY